MGALHIAESKSAIALKAYERKAEKLERERLIAQSQMDETAVPDSSAAEKLELALTFLANPWKLWENGSQTMRRTALKLAFAERMPYCRKTGPRTPKTTLPFKALAAIQGGEMLNGARRGMHGSFPAEREST